MEPMLVCCEVWEQRNAWYMTANCPFCGNALAPAVTLSFGSEPEKSYARYIFETHFTRSYGDWDYCPYCGNRILWEEEQEGFSGEKK